MFLLLIISLITLYLLIYSWFKRNSYYWKNLNIPYPKPHIFFGNLKENVFLKKNFIQIYTKIYNDFPDFPYVGFFKMRTPSILIRDPKLINNVLAKDFSSFDENFMKLDETLDPLGSSDPFFQTGSKWKATRSKLSACFTSGKLKLILPLTLKVTDDMMKYIKNRSINYTTLETYELMCKFTTDNIASCGFGFEANSFIEEDAEFRKFGRNIMKQSALNTFLAFIFILFPSLMTMFRLKFISAEADEYFRNVVKSALNYRKTNKIVRNDFLDIIGSQEKNLDELTGHAFTIFLDGFETSSAVLSYTIYELSRNQDIQDKVRKEIDQVLNEHNNAINYEGLQKMVYLDCIISESLRLHPPGAVLMKTCTKDYYFPAINGNEHDLLVKKNTPIIIPLYGIHRDPKYFPNPEVFDPERFSEENRANIVKGTYSPFGEGPRMCVGMKFAQFQVKIALVALIKNFVMKVNKKTREPLEIEEKHFLLAAKGGIWIDYYQRH